MITETITIDVRRIPYGLDVEQLIEKLQPDCGITALKKHIENGMLSVYEITREEKRLAILITRIDTLLDDSQELVIMHAIGSFGTVKNLVSILGPAFDELAKLHQVKAVRVHTDRRGMDKLLEDNGYKYQESIFKKRLN